MHSMSVFGGVCLTFAGAMLRSVQQVEEQVAHLVVSFHACLHSEFELDFL